MENQLLHTASTICHIAFASTGITTPSDEQGFFHLSDSIHNRLRAISPDLHVRCASYLFLPVIHTELKTCDLKNHFPAYILQLVQELAPLKGLPVHPEKSGLIKSWKPCFQPVQMLSAFVWPNIFRAHPVFSG
ncbi:hypothetical protein M5585_31410 (plasmid) [Serratia ureilytica]